MWFLGPGTVLIQKHVIILEKKKKEKLLSNPVPGFLSFNHFYEAKNNKKYSLTKYWTLSSRQKLVAWGKDLHWLGFNL